MLWAGAATLGPLEGGSPPPCVPPATVAMWPLGPLLGQFKHQRSVATLPAGGPVHSSGASTQGRGGQGTWDPPLWLPRGHRGPVGGALAPSCPLIGCVALGGALSLGLTFPLCPTHLASLVGEV